MKRLICGDVLTAIPKLDQTYQCLIADPPDNIGLSYDVYKDRVPDHEYKEFLKTFFWIAKYYSKISWISFNAKHLFKVGSLVEELLHCCPNYRARIFIQSFTFGQNQNVDFGNGFRPWLRIKHTSAKTYPNAVRVPSWRQLNGDKRANPEGKVPLDHWPFPRVTGNSKQRRPWHPTQLHEDMIKRIIDFSTKPGDRVCDAFSGSGTVLRAAEDRHVTSIELSPEYCKHLSNEHNLEIEYV